MKLQVDLHGMKVVLCTAMRTARTNRLGSSKYCTFRTPRRYCLRVKEEIILHAAAHEALHSVQRLTFLSYEPKSDWKIRCRNLTERMGTFVAVCISNMMRNSRNIPDVRELNKASFSSGGGNLGVDVGLVFKKF